MCLMALSLVTISEEEKQVTLLQYNHLFMQIHNMGTVESLVAEFIEFDVKSFGAVYSNLANFCFISEVLYPRLLVEGKYSESSSFHYPSATLC